MGDYKRVDPNHPFIGLNNEICEKPRHYCCCHDVWLSETDSRKRKCRNKDGKICECFRENHYNKNIERLLRKTRPAKSKHSTRYY